MHEIARKVGQLTQMRGAAACWARSQEASTSMARATNVGGGRRKAAGMACSSEVDKKEQATPSHA